MELQTSTLVIAAVGFIAVISLLIVLYCFNDGIEYWIRTHTEAWRANRRLKRLYKHFIVRRLGGNYSSKARKCVYRLLSTKDYYNFTHAILDYRYHTHLKPSAKLPKLNLVSYDAFLLLRRYETGTK